MPGVKRVSDRSNPLRRAWQLSRSVDIAAALTGVSLGSSSASSQPVRVFEQEIVCQRGDYNCGPAALATLMAARPGADLDLAGLMARFGVSAAETTRIREEGFSLEQEKDSWLAMFTYNSVEGAFFDDNPGQYIWQN